MNGKYAFITGGSSKLGAKISLFLASIGYSPIIHFNRSADAANALSKEIIERFKVDSYTYKADFSKVSQAEFAIKSVFSRTKNLSILINNAATFCQSKIKDANHAQFELEMNVNALSPCVMAMDFLSICEGEGSIINIIDNWEKEYSTNEHLYYLMSKKSTIEMFKVLSQNNSNQKININNIMPGSISTDQHVDVINNKIKEFIQDKSISGKSFKV